MLRSVRLRRVRSARYGRSGTLAPVKTTLSAPPASLVWMRSPPRPAIALPSSLSAFASSLRPALTPLRLSQLCLCPNRMAGRSATALHYQQQCSYVRVSAAAGHTIGLSSRASPAHRLHERFARSPHGSTMMPTCGRPPLALLSSALPSRLPRPLRSALLINYRRPSQQDYLTTTADTVCYPRPISRASMYASLE